VPYPVPWRHALFSDNDSQQGHCDEHGYSIIIIIITKEQD